MTTQIGFKLRAVESEAFKARCAELGVAQAEVIRGLLRQWTRLARADAIVIPTDSAQILLDMFACYDATRLAQEARGASATSQAGGLSDG